MWIWYKYCFHSWDCLFVQKRGLLPCNNIIVSWVPIYELLISVPVLLVFCSEGWIQWESSGRLSLTLCQVQCVWFYFKSLIHLEVSFAQGQEYRSLCIHLPVELQFKKHHFAKPSVALVGTGWLVSWPWDRAPLWAFLPVDGCCRLK